ncbi:putative D-cysteine desulfhydrase, PLP-dependent enzyme [Marinomonas sp. MED121]|uniref:1-aminocyclopropane-1-carboxylate deaminase/D-cysteine desulfhydrase n=1 Tax=Marinomonas sp. MED121 TaxID=314277 RepID=UPI000068FFAF|nr:putative D-cysteine desulfhydrase, PLP-dependent enzyme [Marinomonas sp. MED121]EAQ66675.1 putative D-cysteine desulfhydrase, PLP-dependent enzyme [Marinomonas sp. MED121]
MIHPLTLTLDDQLLRDRNISVCIYRGDLEYADAPGNKWHKLRFNLAAAKAQGAKHLISFGGPFSNHLHALANTAQQEGMIPVAIVRGELQPQLTPTLRDFVAAGGILWPSKRVDYRAGMESDFVSSLKGYYPDAFWVPEGGSNSLGVKGCYYWANAIKQQADEIGSFDTWLVSAGTGATSAGFLANDNVPNMLVFPALKGGEALLSDIHSLALQQNPDSHLQRLSIVGEYHHGGYARLPSELKDYIEQLHQLNPHLRLDPVYTAKLVYGVEQEIRKGKLTNQKLLLIHTGGLQGWRGYQ